MTREIKYTRISLACVYWEITGPWIGITRNGTENNLRKAKKAAQHALRQHQQKEKRES